MWTARCRRHEDFAALRAACWTPHAGQRRPTGPPATGTDAYGLLKNENHILIFDQQVSMNSKIGQSFAPHLRQRRAHAGAGSRCRRTPERAGGSLKMLILAN